MMQAHRSIIADSVVNSDILILYETMDKIFSFLKTADAKYYLLTVMKIWFVCLRVCMHWEA